VLLAVLATGFAMLLSAMFVYFRDIQPIWEVVTQVVFYASPVIIPIEDVEEKLHGLLLNVYMLNPLAIVFQQFRHSFVNHAAPSVFDVMGSHLAVLEPIALTLAIFVLGFVVFNRTAPHIAEDL